MFEEWILVILEFYHKAFVVTTPRGSPLPLHHNHISVILSPIKSIVTNSFLLLISPFMEIISLSLMIHMSLLDFTIDW